MPGGLRRIEMVAIRVRDWPAALTWYTDVLGLTPAIVEQDDEFAMLAAGDGARPGWRSSAATRLMSGRRAGACRTSSWTTSMR